MKKRLLSAFLSLCMVLTMVPTMAFAAGDGDSSQTIQNSPITETQNGVTVSKSLSGTGDAEDPYELTLEAYASGTVSGDTSVPLDIVLVIDQSSSMAYDDDGEETEISEDRRITKLKDALEEFVNTIQQDAEKNSVNHKIAMVGFASNAGGNGSDFDGTGITTGSAERAWQNTGLYIDGVMKNYQSQATKDSYEEIYADKLNPSETYFITDYHIEVSYDSEKGEWGYYGITGRWNNVTPKEDARDWEQDHTQFYVLIPGTPGGSLTNADYQAALVPVNKNNAVNTDLTNAINNMAVCGGTYTYYGLEMAKNVFANNSAEDRKRVVVLFSDGESSSDPDDVLVQANALKQTYGATVYCVGFGQDFEMLNYVSSEYTEASATWEGVIFGKWKYSGTPNSDDTDYSLVANNSTSLSSVFETISGSISSVKVGEDSVLSDTLSEYFDFGDINYSSASGVVRNGVTVETVAATGTGDIPTWSSTATELEDAEVTISGDTISVTGFDYSAEDNVVVKQNDNWQGKKLRITFPVSEDTVACLKNPTGDSMYPTNDTTGSRAGLTYKEGSALLNESPKVHLTDLSANGTDITVQVYVDGVKQEAPLDLVNITRNTRDTNFNYFAQVGDIVGGTITYDFDYNPNPASGHDCVDINVELTDADNYVLQGIVYNQDYGSNGGNNVAVSGSTYTVDNVTAQGNDTDPDVEIYLSTKYTVQYYKDGTSDGTATGTFIAHEGVGTASFTELDAAGQREQSWKNSNYETSVTLKELPADEGNTTYTGWYLGSATNTGTKYDPNTSLAISAENDKAGSDAEDHIIKLYAVGQAKTGTVTIKYQDTKGNEVKEDHTETGDTDAAYNFTVSQDANAVIPFVITNGDTTYVFDHIAEGSAALSGQYKADEQIITAVYKVDSTDDEQYIPDDYIATVTYKIENGTWNNDSDDDIVRKFVTKTFDAETNTWEDAGAKLDGTVPEGMQPDPGYSDSGSWSPETPTNSTAVEDGAVYTYTFSNKLTYTVTFNYVTDDTPAETLKNSETDSTQYTYEDSFTYSASHDETGLVPGVIEKDNNRYIYESADKPLSGTITDNVTITLTYTLDNWDDEDNKETGGDDIPDKYQAVVKFMSADDAQGTVTGDGITQVFTLKDSNGDPAETGSITPANTDVEAEAKTGYAFDIWTEGEGATGVNPFTERTATGGKVITFYANFAEDKIGGEGTPDKYQATVTYKVVGGTWSDNTSEDINEVFTLYTYENGVWIKRQNVTLTSDSHTIPADMIANEGYLADSGSWGDNMPEDDTNVVNGTIYTYTFVKAAPGLSISKTLSSVTRGTATLEDEELNDYVAQVGDTLHYTITVTNTGNTVQSGEIKDTFTVNGETATLANVKVTPASAATITSSPWTFTGLAVSGKIEITADYTVKAGDKLIINTVAPGKDTTKDSTEGDDSVVTNVADLTVKKTADKKSASIGDTIQYTITVTNTGGVALTNVAVTDSKMPSGSTVTTTAASGETSTSATSMDGTYTIASLDVGAKVEITYNYTVTAADVAAGSVSNTVTAGSDQTKEPDPDDPNDPGSDTTTTTILGIDTAEKSVVRVKPTIQDITFPENITYPETDQIAAEVGDNITLLYAVTLKGDAGAAFTVQENVADGTVAYIDAVDADGDFDDETNTFSGTLTATEATLYFTKTFTVTDTTQSLTNSVKVSGIEDDPSSEIDVVAPGLSVTKELSSVTRGDSTLTGDELTDYIARVGDTLHYTITVENTGNTVQSGEIKDTFTVDGETATLANVKVTPDDAATITSSPWTFTGLAVNGTIIITADYTIQDGDKKIVNTVDVTSSDNNTPDVPEVKVETEVPEQTITISPADIVIYTGGDGYGGVTDGNGDIIDGTQASGLPEPGYHLELPDAVQEWLAANGINNGSSLTDQLHFTYNYGGETRDWKLSYVGVYATDSDGNPTQYVYSLAPATVGEKQIPVRLVYKNAQNNVVDDDDILMTETSVNATYTMSIDSGTLDQSQVKAKFTVGEDTNQKTLTCNVEVKTGKLTVKSVANETVKTNEIAADETTIDNDIITAVGSGVTYYVNNSEVQVDADRVQLLVDEVSNEPDYNEAMGEDAIDKVQADAAYANNLTNPAYDSAYLDLVDTKNGNAVVTMGNDDKLTIYWPVPEDAASDSAFYVVHYTDMNRGEQEVAGEVGLQTASTKIETAQTTEVDGKKYVTFEATSFSPYVLVYSGTHTVTFNKGANGSLADQDADGNVIVSNIADGSKLTDEQIPAVNANSGYSFTGWKMTGDTDPDKIYSNADIAAMEITDDLTFTAQYTSSGGSSGTTRYTLTYESNGGTEYDSERYTRNTVVELDKVPSREGYTFTGWYADEDLTEQITEIKMTSNKTVYAGWEATGVPDWLNGDDHFAYVIGYPDGTVRPLNNISRAEVATIFFRLLKPEIRDENLTTTNQFTDVDADAWYNTAVSTMAQLGIVKGRSADTFDPNAPITRAEFAAICARFDTNQRDGDSNFSDIAGHWAEAEIERAVLLGWINGYTDGTFRPDNQITRAEAMAMINRVLQRLPETEDDLLDDMNVWPDNQSSQWYYLAVQEATNSHDFERKGEVHEKWTEMTTDPDWTQYE